MQYSVAVKKFAAKRSVVAAVKLSVVWLVGLAFGAYIGSNAAGSLRPWLLSICAKNVTFMGTALVLLIPFMFTVCAACLFHSDSVLLVAFVKAAMFSLVAVSCVYCWGSAGWLVARLLLFSDLLCAPVLIWTWHRVLCGMFSKKEALVSFLFILMIGIMDHFAVSPLLYSLF